MILETLSAADRYAPLHPGFAAALAFLRRADLADLPDGNHTLDGERLFAIIARGQGRGRDASKLEYHRRYIDVQFVVSGDEVIGWSPLANCTQEDIPFTPEKDIGFQADRPAAWVAVPPGMLAVFFPNDAHAPLAGSGPAHKVVVKVQAAW